MSNPSWGEPRSKTVTWWDPIANARSASSGTGLEHLQALLAGEGPPPPIAQLMGFTLQSVAEGDAVFVCTPDESAYNPIGVVHGGLVCTLLDSAIGCAVQTTLPAGAAYTSIEIKISYLRAVHAHTGELRVHGWVTKPGRRVAFGEADVRDAGGTIYATASSTCLVMSG